MQVTAWKPISLDQGRTRSKQYATPLLKTPLTLKRDKLRFGGEITNPFEQDLKRFLDTMDEKEDRGRFWRQLRAVLVDLPPEYLNLHISRATLGVCFMAAYGSKDKDGDEDDIEFLKGGQPLWDFIEPPLLRWKPEIRSFEKSTFFLKQLSELSMVLRTPIGVLMANEIEITCRAQILQNEDFAAQYLTPLAYVIAQWKEPGFIQRKLITDILRASLRHIPKSVWDKMIPAALDWADENQRRHVVQALLDVSPFSMEEKQTHLCQVYSILTGDDPAQHHILRTLKTMSIGMTHAERSRLVVWLHERGFMKYSVSQRDGWVPESFRSPTAPMTSTSETATNDSPTETPNTIARTLGTYVHKILGRNNPHHATFLIFVPNKLDSLPVRQAIETIVNHQQRPLIHWDTFQQPAPQMADFYQLLLAQNRQKVAFVLDIDPHHPDTNSLLGYLSMLDNHPVDTRQGVQVSSEHHHFYAVIHSDKKTLEKILVITRDSAEGLHSLGSRTGYGVTV